MSIFNSDYIRRKSTVLFIILLSFSLILNACVDNKRTNIEELPVPTPTPDPTDTGTYTPSYVFTDSIVETAYRKHKAENSCASMPMASPEIYELAFEKMQWISRRRGLDYKPELFPSICTPTQKDYAADWIEEIKANKEELQLRGERYKAMGLFPINLDYYEMKLKSAKTSSSGYYVPSTNMLTVRSGYQDQQGFEATLVHELVHALQNQHYPSSRMYSPPDARILSNDEDEAVKAIYEGEATLTQQLYTHEVQNKELMSDQEIRQKVREYYSESKLLPLSRSARLVRYWVSVPFFRMLMGSEYNAEAIDRVFNDPPDSTEQIYFPLKYLSNEQGHFHEAFDLSDYDSVFSDHLRINNNIYSLGHYGLLDILRTYDNEVDPFTSVKGWDGDRLLLYAKDENFNWWETTFIHLGKWDSWENAANFAAGLHAMIQSKYGELIEFASGEERSFRVYLLNEKYDNELVIVGSKKDRTIMAERISIEKARQLSYLGDDEILGFLNAEL